MNLASGNILNRLLMPQTMSIWKCEMVIITHSKSQEVFPCRIFVPLLYGERQFCSKDFFSAKIWIRGRDEGRLAKNEAGTEKDLEVPVCKNWIYPAVCAGTLKPMWADPSAWALILAASVLPASDFTQCFSLLWVCSGAEPVMIHLPSRGFHLQDFCSSSDPTRFILRNAWI